MYVINLFYVLICRFLHHSMLAEKEKLKRNVIQCENQLKKHNESHRIEKDKLQVMY